MVKWISICFLVVCFLAGAYLVVGENGLRQVYRLKTEKTQLQERKVELQQQKEEYLQRIDRLRSDPVAIEREIRKDLKYVRADETVFIVNPSETGTP